MTTARCPQCKNRIIQKSGAEVRVHIQGGLTIGEDGTARSECRTCRTPVEVPLELTKAFSTPVRERVIIVERGFVKPPSGEDT